MVEKRKVRGSEEVEKDLETVLRENIARHSASRDYDEIPNELKSVAAAVAVGALLFPRIPLFNELERLDQQASEEPDSAAAYDAKVNGSLIERRDIEKVKIYRKKRMVLQRGRVVMVDLFNEVHKSTFLTRLDRILLASRNGWVSLAEHRPEMDQDPIFAGAVSLSEKLVADSFTLLPSESQRDPTTRHPYSPTRAQTRKI